MPPEASVWWKETFVPHMPPRISRWRGFWFLEEVEARLEGKEVEVVWLVETAPNWQSGELGVTLGPAAL